MTKLLLVVAIVVGMMSLKGNHQDKVEQAKTAKYIMEIYNEHEVVLIGVGVADTIVLSFENAYALAEQSDIVFVSK